MTTELRDREQHFSFHCPELGIEASSPDFIPTHLFKYFTAMTYAVDLPPESREQYIDIGCGSGHGTELVSAFFKSSYGIDRDETAIGYARKMHGRAGTKFLKTDAMETKMWHGKVDYITAIEMLEHVPQNLAPVLLGEIQSWLTPTGLFFMTTPVASTKDGVNPENPWHLHEYQPGELKELLDKSFKSVKIAGLSSSNMIAVCTEPRK